MSSFELVTKPFKLDVQEIKAAREQLLEDGYCLVDGHLPERALAQLRTWSDDWLARTEHPAHWKYQGSDVKISGIRNVARRTPDMPKDEMVDFLIEHPARIMSALGISDLKAGGAFQIISKPAKAPALYWHQDWARWDDPISLSPWPQQVFLNWYLTDTCVENGCIRVIPGSHRKRLDLHENLIQPHEGGGYDVSETNEWMFLDHPASIDIPVKAGQLMIGDARLLHGTHPNQSNERRTVLLAWYYRKSNEVPLNWDGPVPPEIAQRDPDFPMRWNRTPGEYLRN